MQIDLDRLQRKRVGEVLKKKGELHPEDVFVSEKVISTIAEPKILMGSYDERRVRALLPFSPVLLVETCPYCVSGSKAVTFSKLVRAGLVIPVLTAPYSAYPHLIDLFGGQDHISAYEANAFVMTKLIRDHFKNGGRAICRHCAEKRVRAMVRTTKAEPDAEFYREASRDIRQRLAPYLYPDYELLDRAVVACKERDHVALDQLKRLSEALRQIRLGEAFSAATIIDSRLRDAMTSPVGSENISAEAGYAELSAASLGLTIPDGILVDRYIEIVKDYQPAISRALNDIVAKSKGNDSKVSYSALARELKRINTEVTRVKSTKRYKFLEVCVDFYRNNKGIISTALLASAFGLAGSLTGCGATLVTGAAAKAAKKFGLLKGTSSSQRLGEMIGRDIRPQINTVIARYVGTEVAAINVLSLQNRLHSG